MVITNSSHDDLDMILRLYDSARTLMRSKGQVTWPLFDQEMITREIDQGHQWKLMVEDEIACIWATTFSDPLIWGDKPEPSLYIHRLTTAAAHRGKGHSHKAIQWARVHAKEKGKTYVRLDTVGHNEGLIKHYVSFGFVFLGMYELPQAEGLPAHYQEDAVARFEMRAI